MQTAGSVEMIREAKRNGQRISAEINPWALFLGNKWENIERLGSYALSYWVPETNTEPLWQGLRDGTIDSAISAPREIVSPDTVDSRLAGSQVALRLRIIRPIPG